MSIFPRLRPPDTGSRRCVSVERDALHQLLLEVHDLRARQGVDWRWTDALPPLLQQEIRAAFDEEDRLCRQMIQRGEFGVSS